MARMKKKKITVFAFFYLGATRLSHVHLSFFFIFLEPFSLSNILSSFIGGFKLKANEARILAFANDVTIFLLLFLFLFCVDSESVEKDVELYVARKYE